jgi:1-acyl-sn-glycerol-3-phosphate acyltransferase
MKVALRIAAMAAVLALCLPLHGLWRLLRLRSPWPRIFLLLVGRFAGLRPIRVGKPLRNHVLLVGNHLSWLDILLVAGASGAAFVSRDDVARWPLIGWLATLNNTVFVARADRRNVHGQAEALRAALATGQPVALFPEGTTDGGIEVLPFRASLFAALLPADGVKVQPVAIDYGPAGHDIAWVGGEPAGSNMKRVLARRGSIPVRIEFLPPIEPASFEDRKSLAEAARAAILEALVKQDRIDHSRQEDTR